MSEPTVTIKFTETELKNVNKMINICIDKLLEVPPLMTTLQKELKKIEKWILDEKHKAITDKKASKESFKKQTEMETSKRICVPCED